MPLVGNYKNFRIIYGRISKDELDFVYYAVHLPDSGYYLDRFGRCDWGTFGRHCHFSTLEELEESLSIYYKDNLKLNFTRTRKEIL